MNMNNIKMSEMTVVGTWLYHWFPRIYPYILILLTSVLFHRFDHSKSRIAVKLMKYYSSYVKET